MTLLHEFGHAIGLRHSDNKADIMYKELQRNRVILSIGDVLAAQAFYGVPLSVGKLLHQCRLGHKSYKKFVDWVFPLHK